MPHALSVATDARMPVESSQTLIPITAAQELLLLLGLFLETCCKTEPVQKEPFAPCYTQPQRLLIHKPG